MLFNPQTGDSWSHKRERDYGYTDSSGFSGCHDLLARDDASELYRAPGFSKDAFERNLLRAMLKRARWFAETAERQAACRGDAAVYSN